MDQILEMLLLEQEVVDPMLVVEVEVEVLVVEVEVDREDQPGLLLRALYQQLPLSLRAVEVQVVRPVEMVEAVQETLVPLVVEVEAELEPP